MRATNWAAEHLPTRTEALMAAARAMSMPDEWVPPDAVHAHADLARAWMELADRVPEAPPEWPTRSPAAAPAEDRMMVGTCGHQCTAIRARDAGRWMHLPSLTTCDSPPATFTPVPGE